MGTMLAPGALRKECKLSRDKVSIRYGITFASNITLRPDYS